MARHTLLRMQLGFDEVKQCFLACYIFFCDESFSIIFMSDGKFDVNFDDSIICLGEGGRIIRLNCTC